MQIPGGKHSRQREKQAQRGSEPGVRFVCWVQGKEKGWCNQSRWTKVGVIEDEVREVMRDNKWYNFGFYSSKWHGDSLEDLSKGFHYLTYFFNTEVNKLQPAGHHLLFLNKVLLKYSHAHFFTYCLWLLSAYNGRNETIWSTRPNIFAIWPFTEKCKEWRDPNKFKKLKSNK